MLLSVIVPTRNESKNLPNCLRAFERVRSSVELIVVDNASTDETKAIAAEFGAIVLDKGPERSAQRNLGWRTATADWVVILDADMILPEKTIEAIFSVIRQSSDESHQAPLAYWIPEIRTGKGLRVKARNFERSFYDGTAIDALRLFHRSVLEKTGGYDEDLIAGPEDWELDIRVLQTGAKCAVLAEPLLHNERNLSLRRVLEKKAYYTKSMARYQAKWKGHPALAKQFGFGYRYFGVFVENGKWKKLFAHPILAAVMYFERILVGLVYLTSK